MNFSGGEEERDDCVRCEIANRTDAVVDADGRPDGRPDARPESRVGMMVDMTAAMKR